MKRLAILFSTFGYVGYCPVAPGTAGSAAALVLYGLLRGAGAPAVADLAATALLFAIGVWAGGVAERHFGRTDPGHVVLDEVIGMLLTLVFIPVNVWGVVAGFFLFRLFDIVKPFPARQCERLHGGLGIMADDAVAGLYGHLTLRLLVWLVPFLRLG